MKMDKIAFANLVSYLSYHGFTVTQSTLGIVDDMINIDVPMPAPPVPVKASCADVDALLAAMIKNGGKIEAIKAYRTLTGAGLKESKDAVERYATGAHSNHFDAPRSVFG